MTREPPLVLHVLHHLYIGGMENGLVNLVNHMPRDRYRHAIACVEDYSDFRNRITTPGVEVIALERSKVGNWRMRRTLYELCRRLKPAVLHSRNQSGLDALVPARLAGVKGNVHSEHGWDVGNLHGERRKPIILRQLHSPFVDRYVTVSRDLENFLASKVHIARRRITQIYNGVDTDRFVPGGAQRHGALPEHLRGEGVVVVGTVGRVQAVKDQATLMRAFAALRERQGALRDRLRLAIVGDGPLLESLRGLAAELGIADATWLPGALSNVPQVMQGFDVFVLPSLNEGISNTILEAMASGLPVVATAVGGNPELVDDGVSGRLFAPADVATLSSLLGDYAVDPALRAAHSAAARRAAVDRFSLPAMVGAYAATYDAVSGRAWPG